MAQGFLLKYAEIGVKGKNRYKFEDALCDQIRLRLSGIDGDFTVQKESGRVLFRLMATLILMKLSRLYKEYLVLQE